MRLSILVIQSKYNKSFILGWWKWEQEKRETGETAKAESTELTTD